MQLLLTFTAAALTDFALLAWMAAGGSGRAWRAASWSVVVAGLSLAGLAGALDSSLGIIAYLAGNAAGSYVSAKLNHQPGT